jgi:hypothetical protein
MINQIEWIRKQTYDLTALLEGDENAEEIGIAAKQLDEKLIAFEENLFQMKRTEGADTYRWKTKLYGRILFLASELPNTWGGVGNDFSPTTQQIEVHEVFKERLAKYQGQFNELLSKDIPDFNSLLKERNISSIITSTP